MPKPQYISYSESIQRLKSLAAEGAPDFQWDWENNRLHASPDAAEWTFQLPFSFPPVPIQHPRSRYDGPARLRGPQPPSMGLLEYAQSLPASPPPYLLILIQAGHSAIGFFEGGEATHHKVIKKYMVRGNGRAQIGYLGSRGKSKAGSRVRLANSVRFFEEINEKLIEWGKLENATRIFLSCPVKVQPIWYAADPPPPFLREDPRIMKVPMDVQRPDLHQLLHIARQLDSGFWEGEALEGLWPAKE